MNKDRLAARLLATFLGELEEQLRVLNAELLALEANPGDRERLRAVFRVAHTLKGAARAAGVPLIERACHALEALLAEARDGKLTLAVEHFRLLFAAADALSDAGARLRDGRELEGSELARLTDALAGPMPEAAAPAATRAGLPPVAPALAQPAARTDGQVRVQAAKLDVLLAAAGELLVARGRLTARTGDIQALHDLATQCLAEWRRTSRGLRISLERSGSAATPGGLAETTDALLQLAREAGRVARAVREDVHELAASVEEVLHGVRELRMRPFTDACEALPRAARDLAATVGKEIDLEISGGDVEADRAVLDGLREALLQLVRNAVDHGIEASAERVAAGKPRRGRIHVGATLQGDRIIVTVSDDGAGFNVAAVRAALARRGQSVPEAERDVVHALFESGLSTRPEAGVVSGRGVGLDVVREAASRIRGTVSAAWEMGGGTRIEIRCPPSLASIRAVLVAVGSQPVAIPTTHVERLLRVRLEAVKQVEGRRVIATPEGPVPLVALARLLPPLPEKPAAGPIPVVLLATASRRVALAVDELVAEDEVVLRPLRLASGPARRVSAAALLSSGQIALVADPEALVAAGLDAAAQSGIALTAPEPGRPSKRRVLVVDDSLTTRTLEQSILEAAGYDVLTAVDGSDGWRVLQEQGCDLVVADIEMPRMDGFALCEAIRASQRFKELPVVLVTALETPEHRARGLEVGADAYIGKSSFDQQNLLDIIKQLLG
jgi:two-component system chemotaxis sensor kinase CheA